MKKRKLIRLHKLRESLLTGIKEIRYNKLRSLLTLFGIMLGVASLIAMMSITEGYKQNFIKFMDAHGGLSLVTVSNVDSETLAELKTRYNAEGLIIEDIDTIMQNNGDIIETISPVKSGGRFLVKYGNKSIRLWGQAVVGATKSFGEINDLVIGQGRNLTDFDDVSNSRVTVIGSIVKDILFGDSINPLGENISVNGNYLTVVGTYAQYSAGETSEPAGTTNAHQRAIVTDNTSEHLSGRHLWQMYGRTDPFWRKNMNVVIPISTFSNLYRPDETLSSINIRFKDSVSLDEYVEKIRISLLSNRLGYEDFEIDTQAEMFEESQKQMRTMTLVFGAIAIISLLVGGIGIMNVILASISERIREIGVRKSVGARKADIFVQFLIETIVLSTLGGLLGVLAGSSMSIFIAKIANMETLVSPFAIGLALISSCIIGIIFGIYPSLRAAKLNPIDALRYE